MSAIRTVPELLAPAGSLEAAMAAVANGADAVYLGAGAFNARDEGAQLTLDELSEVCRLARDAQRRVYLALNTLVKPAELGSALHFLGEAIDRGIHAAIVQDIGLVRLIRRVYPELELHGSTQMTVHDPAGAAVMRRLGLSRVVLARENTLEDIDAIRRAVPELALETFVHGALCIAYSGQCFMSGMISERSANRGSCAQSCRKDYVLRDGASGETLDQGFLISARDLAAHEHLDALAVLGVQCLKVEGRKKRPEYVATVTRQYRTFLDRLAEGEVGPPPSADVEPLVQIFSRGFTGGMLGGRQGRDYVTRTHAGSRGVFLGTVIGRRAGDLIVELSETVVEGDGLGFEAEEGARETLGCAVTGVRTVSRGAGGIRQAIRTGIAVPPGWRVLRNVSAAVRDQARATDTRPPRTMVGTERVDVRVFGSAGGPLKALFASGHDVVTVVSTAPLTPATTRPLDEGALRAALGRLGGTPFVLGTVNADGLATGLFLPVSEVNHLRQAAVEQLGASREWAERARIEEREALIAAAVTERIAIASTPAGATIVRSVTTPARAWTLSAEVFSLEDARTAAAAGATDVIMDPFLRHPAPPRARVRALADELGAAGVSLWVRTPTIVRPEDRRRLEPWLELGLPIVTGHIGLVSELAAAGVPVCADYAVNCFNEHTASELFALGAGRVVASVELTVDEVRSVVAPWHGKGFEVLIYGRPEGMTIEHCVLSAAFDREPTTCRDLCVQRHPDVHLTDPAGYAFPVATDSDCRNRLLHSRPIEGSEYLLRLWTAGIRAYKAVFNVHDAPVESMTAAYRSALEALAAGERPDLHRARAVVGSIFTRGHFAHAV